MDALVVRNVVMMDLVSRILQIVLLLLLLLTVVVGVLLIQQCVNLQIHTNALMVIVLKLLLLVHHNW
jgi:hypothetical protein